MSVPATVPEVVHGAVPVQEVRSDDGGGVSSSGTGGVFGGDDGVEVG